MKKFNLFTSFILSILLFSFSLGGFGAAYANAKPIEFLKSVRTGITNQSALYGSNRIYAIGRSTSIVAAEVRTFNVSNPSDPTLINTVSINNVQAVYSYALGNNYLYIAVAISNKNYIYVYSVANSSGVPVYESRRLLSAPVTSLACDNQNHLYASSANFIMEYTYIGKQLKPTLTSARLSGSYTFAGSVMAGNYLVTYTTINNNLDQLVNVYNKNTLALATNPNNLGHDYITAMANSGSRIFVALAQATARPAVTYYDITSSGQLSRPAKAVTISGSTVGEQESSIAYADNSMLVSNANDIEMYTVSPTPQLSYNFSAKVSFIQSFTSDQSHHLYTLNNYNYIPELSSYLVSR